MTTEVRGVDRRPPVIDEHITARFNAQDEILKELVQHMQEQTETLKIHMIKSDMIADDLNALVNLWRASKVLAVAVTWIAGGVTILYKLAMWAKDHLHF
jgi:predicted small metal-binding protein